MNAQESHDFLLKKFDKSCRNYLYQNADKIEFEQALYDGAEALEKQIPKKPIPNSRDMFGIKCCICPVCSCHVYSTSNSFCHRCGQALDWSDSE